MIKTAEGMTYIKGTYTDIVVDLAFILESIAETLEKENLRLEDFVNEALKSAKIIYKEKGEMREAEK